MTQTALVIGETGQVATELGRLQDPRLRVVTAGRRTLDLADPAAAGAFVAEADADVVINAAAYTNVDKAEEEEDLATRVNGEAPGAMAAAAAKRGLPFLHISTDYVFDGSGDRPWRETDPTSPLGAYGRSKLAGEQAVAAAGGAHVILRTAWVFASHGGNFMRTMLRVGKTRPALTVVDDQHGGPTPARDIAAALATIACAFGDGKGASGVFHFAGAPPTTWRRFAEAIFADADWPSKPDVTPIRTEDWPTAAARPKNSVLNCQRILEAYGISQPDWREILPTMLAEAEGEDA